MKRMMTLLNLSEYQKAVIIGRTLKRLYKMTKNNKSLRQNILDKDLFFSHKNYSYVVIYEIDKIFNWSKLHS